MRFRYYEASMAEAQVLSVGGVAPSGPNLSAWPGNRTPEILRAPTATEMALDLAVWPQRSEWLAGAETVTHTRYDTDGLLAVWSVLHPWAALAYRETLVAAAEANAFGHAVRGPGLALHLALDALAHHPNSPIAADLQGGPEDRREASRYAYLLEILPVLLDGVDDHRGLWASEEERIISSLVAIDAGGVEARCNPELDLAVLSAHRPISDVAVTTRFRNARLLVGEAGLGGTTFRFRYSPESWFERPGRSFPPRRDLRPLAAGLSGREPNRGVRWTVTDPEGVSPVLQSLGSADRPAPSGLTPEVVEAAVRDHLSDTDAQTDPPTLPGQG